MKVSTEIDNNFGKEKLSTRGRKRTLTDSEIKRNRSEVSSKWNTCRIYVGDQLDRWNELKEVLRVQAHAEVAKILLESIFIYFYASSPHAAACRVCLHRKYGRFMLLIDNNLLLPNYNCGRQYAIKLLKYLNSPPGFSGVRVTRSLVFCAMLCGSLFILFPFFLI
jgi:hypothetical protein